MRPGRLRRKTNAVASATWRGSGCGTARKATERRAAAGRWLLCPLGWHDDRVIVSADFSAIPDSMRAAEIEQLCDAMEAADKAGRYPQLIVERPWSVHNPRLEGEFASPRAIRWYLERELARLAADGARGSGSEGRPALDLP